MLINDNMHLFNVLHSIEFERENGYCSNEETKERLLHLNQMALEKGELSFSFKVCKELEEVCSEHELHNLLENLGERSYQEGELPVAYDAFSKSGNLERLKIVGKKAFETQDLYTAEKSFDLLRDREGLLKVIRVYNQRDEFGSLEFALQHYLGQDFIREVCGNFDTWLEKKGIPYAPAFETSKVINMAYHLADKYDVGVGIARGGSFSTYIFDLFGLDTKIVDSHRRGRGATFSWINQPLEEELEGKKVVVFDKDVVSGRTTRRIGRELEKYNPERIDLVLNHDPVDVLWSYGSLLGNVSSSYDDVYYPKRFSYRNFDKVVERLEESLENGK